MAKKNKKTQATIPYLFKAKDGNTYALTGAHNDNPGYFWCNKRKGYYPDPKWFYDIKNTETGEHYYKISYNKLKEYL